MFLIGYKNCGRKKWKQTAVRVTNPTLRNTGPRVKGAKHYIKANALNNIKDTDDSDDDIPLTALKRKLTNTPMPITQQPKKLQDTPKTPNKSGKLHQLIEQSPDKLCIIFKPTLG